MAAGAAPAEAPAFSLTIGLWVLVSLVVAIGLKAGWDHSIGRVLRGLASAADVGVWKIKLPAGGGFRKLDDVVQATLGEYILANEQALGLWWHTNVQIIRYLGDSITGFGFAVHDTIDSLVHGTIPATVTAHTRPLAGNIARGNHAAQVRDRAEAKERARGIDATHRDLTAEKLARERGIDNVGAKAHGYTDAAVARVQGAIARERAYAHRVLGGRLGLLDRLLGVGVIGGISIAALTRVFPYWQCSNFRRFARGVCRSPLGALDWLFALAGLAVIALDPEQVLHFAEDATDELGGIIHKMTGLPEA